MSTKTTHHHSSDPQDPGCCLSRGPVLLGAALDRQTDRQRGRAKSAGSGPLRICGGPATWRETENWWGAGSARARSCWCSPRVKGEVLDQGRGLRTGPPSSIFGPSTRHQHREQGGVTTRVKASQTRVSTELAPSLPHLPPSLPSCLSPLPLLDLA